MKDGDKRFPLLSSWLTPELEKRGFANNKNCIRAKRESNGVLQIVERHIGKWGSWYVELGAHPLVIDRNFDVGRSRPLRPRKVFECLFQERLLRRSVPFEAAHRELWDEEVALLGEDMAVRNVREAFARECERGLFSMSAAELTSSDYLALYGLRSMAHVMVLHHEGATAEAREVIQNAVHSCTSEREQDSINKTAEALGLEPISWPERLGKAASWPAYIIEWAVKLGASSEEQRAEFNRGEFSVLDDVRGQWLAGVMVGVRSASATSFKLIVRPGEFTLATALIGADLQRLGLRSQSRPSLFGVPAFPEAARSGLRLEVLPVRVGGPTMQVGAEDGGQLEVPEYELLAAFEQIGADGDDEVELRFTWNSL